MALDDILRELKIPLAVLIGGSILVASIRLLTKNPDPTGVDGKEKAFKTATIVLENVAKMDTILKDMGYVLPGQQSSAQQPIIIYPQPPVQQPPMQFYPQKPDNSTPDASIIPYNKRK